MAVGNVGDGLISLMIHLELDDVTNCLSKQFPDRASTGHGTCQYNCLDNIEQYYAVYFQRSNNIPCLLKDTNSILIWDSDTARRLSNLNMANCSTLNDKNSL